MRRRPSNSFRCLQRARKLRLEADAVHHRVLVSCILSSEVFATKKLTSYVYLAGRRSKVVIKVHAQRNLFTGRCLLGFLDLWMLYWRARDTGWTFCCTKVMYLLVFPFLILFVIKNKRLIMIIESVATWVRTLTDNQLIPSTAQLLSFYQPHDVRALLWFNIHTISPSQTAQV
jgi:hypothetical protein